MDEADNQLSEDELLQIRNPQKTVGGLAASSQEWIKKRFANNPHLGDMLQSIEYTVQCLSDTQAETRLLAIYVINMFFPSVDLSPYMSRFEAMAFGDEDTMIQENALHILARIASRHSEETRRNIAKKIAAVISDESVAHDIRRTGYQALCILSSNYDIRIRSCDNLRFPEDIDWLYVKSWG